MKPNLRRIRALALIGMAATLGTAASARAAIPLPLGEGDLANQIAAQSGSVSTPVIKTVGVGFMHRPYEPATPLGTSAGIDFSIETTMAKIPQDFKDALATLGNGDADGLPVLPVPKLHFHKGFGRTDVGVSAIGYQGYLAYGADVKVVIYNPEEGLTWALRLSYSYTKLGIVTAKTWEPAILISRGFSFANTYAGLGVQLVSGSLHVEHEFDTPFGPQTYAQDFTATARAVSLFMGVGFWIGPTGLKLTLEGSFSSAQAHTMGMKFGFNF
ncbi:MAG: hypothetical protein AB7P04_08020 [Bacteriovoracia bacterium]